MQPVAVSGSGDAGKWAHYRLSFLAGVSPHTTRRMYHGASRLLVGHESGPAKTGRAPFRLCMDSRPMVS